MGRGYTIFRSVLLLYFDSARVSNKHCILTLLVCFFLFFFFVLFFFGFLFQSGYVCYRSEAI